MSMFRALVVLSFVGASYGMWSHHRASAHRVDARATGGPGEFVVLPPVEGQRAQIVFVVAAENCPHEAAQRADHLAQALASRGIPVQRTHEVRFRFTSRPDAATVDRISAVMNGPLPVVFINGRAKSNPSLDEVDAQYRRMGPSPT